MVCVELFYVSLATFVLFRMCWKDLEIKEIENVCVCVCVSWSVSVSFEVANHHIGAYFWCVLSFKGVENVNENVGRTSCRRNEGWGRVWRGKIYFLGTSRCIHPTPRSARITVNSITTINIWMSHPAARGGGKIKKKKNDAAAGRLDWWWWRCFGSLCVFFVFLNRRTTSNPNQFY